MSGERVSSDFCDDSNDSKIDHDESSDLRSVHKEEDTQLILIDLNGGNINDANHPSEEKLINRSLPFDDFEKNFHLTDLPPIDSPKIHASLPVGTVTPIPLLADVVIDVKIPILQECEIFSNSPNISELCDNFVSQSMESTDKVVNGNSDNKPIFDDEINNLLETNIENENQLANVNKDDSIDKVIYTDKNSNCVNSLTLETMLKTQNQSKTSTNGITRTRDTPFSKDNFDGLSFPPLRHCESIPNITENGGDDAGRKWHPIYRFSLRLPQFLPLHFEIPNADSHGQYSKAGFLLKLSGRGFPYLNQWKRRYCVLTKGCLYLYEKETGKGSDKNTSVVDLKYFDHVAEAMQKETRKASNVFVVTSQDRSFFDPGRHLFAADTLTEMHDWIAKLRESIELIRNNNRPTSKSSKGPKKDIQEQNADSDGHQRQNIRTDQHQQAQSPRPKSSPLEDTVDARVFQTDETKEELFLNLQRKFQREQDHHESKHDKSSTDILNDEEEEEAEQGSPSATLSGSVAGKKSSFTTISLQNPSVRVGAKPQLESITKNRNRGPAGRRAPQSRRTVLMKQRASSMSALQHEGQLDDEARDEMVGQNNDGQFDEEHLMMDAASLNNSQPILAYHYSSDEDSQGEDHMGSNRSIGKPTTGSAGQKYSSKTTSYTIDKVPHHPVKGLRVYVDKNAHAPTSSSTNRLLQYPDGDDLLEYRSLPRSLAKASNNNRTIALKGLSKGFQVPSSSGGRGSAGRISSGRASPEMDALDNMFMNRSVHTSVTSQQDHCTSDHEGSEASTFKGIHEEPEDKKSSNIIDNEELTKALERFSSTLQHLQHHTVELDNRTKEIQSEFNISKNDVVNLQGATEGIRKEVKRLSETVTMVAQEASKVKKDFVSQRQETEKLQKEVAEAMLQAKRSQKDFEISRMEYEILIKDLHNMITSIKSSFVIACPEEVKPAKKVPLVETGKSYSENDKSTVNKEEKEDIDYRKPTSEGKKSNKEMISQKGGYQSFFQRPTSLIYGLTSRTSNKSPKKDRDDKDVATSKSEKEEKKKSGKSSSDKKQKGEKQNQNSLERKGKNNKNEEQRETNKDNLKTHSKHKGTNTDKQLKKDENNDLKKCIPSFSIENFPMMDDFSDSLEKRPNSAGGISHVSINVSHVSQNFNLEKSLSSPTVTTKFSNKPRRPNALSIPPAMGDGYKTYSNASSPDSPTNPISTFPFLSNNQINLYEPRIRTSETLFPCQPASTPSVTRQSSLPSSSEDKLINRHRHGVFAISRQRSSPNLPLQRQSSGTLYPLQRQHSLGTVPEEGQVPRQVSLMSVPEDRPIVDQTLPLSPALSMVSFALSPSPSGERLDNWRDRSSARNSMELVTGPVVSGSLVQESYSRQIPSPTEFNLSDFPLATSSLKRHNGKKKTIAETLIL